MEHKKHAVIIVDNPTEELEGLITIQIMEWFEKEHPEPIIPPDADLKDDELWEPLETWHRDLVSYAEGWKDALKALEKEEK